MEKYTQEEIDALLSDNYEGSIEILTENYDGSDDLYLDYDGVRSLKDDMKKSKKRISFTIVNATDEQMVVALNPGMFRTDRSALVYDDSGLKYRAYGGGELAAPAGAVANDIIHEWNDPSEIISAGYTVDAVFDDGIVYALSSNAAKRLTITAQKKEASVRAFLDYIKRNPTSFAGIHITSTDINFYETELTLTRVTPYGKYGEDRVPFQDSNLPTNNNTGKVIIEQSFQLDGETLAVITVPSGATVNISLVAAAVESAAVGLKNKVATVKEKGGVMTKKVVIAKKPLTRATTVKK